MSDAVNIARCPEHGLHGERTECFICGGPVEQVAMVPVVPAAIAADRRLCDHGGLCGRYRGERDAAQARHDVLRAALVAHREWWQRSNGTREDNALPSDLELWRVLGGPAPAGDTPRDPRYIDPGDQTEGQNG